MGKHIPLLLLTMHIKTRESTPEISAKTLPVGLFVKGGLYALSLFNTHK